MAHRHIFEGENLGDAYRLHCKCGWRVMVSYDRPGEAADTLEAAIAYLSSGLSPASVATVLAGALRSVKEQPIGPGRLLVYSVPTLRAVK